MRQALAALSALALCACGPGIHDEKSLRAALNRTSGQVHLPAGTIDIQGELVIPRTVKDLDIRGEGLETVIRAAPGFKGRALFVVEGGARVRFWDLTIDGNRDQVKMPALGLPPSDVPFADFYPNNGILARNVDGFELANMHFRRIPGFAVLVASSNNVKLDLCRVEDSGSRNAASRNNTTGGILFEEGVERFEVSECEFRNIRGNGVWTHSRYESKRNGPGSIQRNRFERIGRDAIQVGHATRVGVFGNTGREIGFPVEEVDIENQAIPVGIDTAGDVDRSTYDRNRFEEVNGKCIDLDGFHDGNVRRNECINTKAPGDYPYAGYAIVMNNTNPDMKPEKVRISNNVIEGAKFGGIFVIGSDNRIENNRLRNINTAHCNVEAARFGCLFRKDEPDLLRAGIYLGKGAERPAPARGSRVTGNRISGFGMKEHCVVSAPGIKPGDNEVGENECADAEKK